MRMHRVVVLAFVLLVAATASVASAATYPQNHNGWNIGFGFGGGTAGVNLDRGGDSDREGGGIGNIRVGYPLNEQVSLQFEGNAWSKTENDVTVTFSASTFGVAFFPSEGWVLRGGLGFGSTRVALSSGNVTTSATESGLGLHGAVGYDFRLARTFALGPQVDAGYATFDGGSSNWVGVGLQFNWYFVPKN